MFVWFPGCLGSNASTPRNPPTPPLSPAPGLSRISISGCIKDLLNDATGVYMVNSVYIYIYMTYYTHIFDVEGRLDDIFTNDNT